MVHNRDDYKGCNMTGGGCRMASGGCIMAGGDYIMAGGGHMQKDCGVAGGAGMLMESTERLVQAAA